MKLFIAIIFIGIYTGLFAQYTVTVDLSNEIRPVTHCASGSLYGVTETLPTDIDNLVTPLNPNVFANPALAGSTHQQSVGAALEVSARLVNTTAKVQIRLADILPNWPYTWPGLTSFLSQCTDVINSKLASGRDNYDGYEIWNEPYGTWDDDNGDYEADLWEPTYDLIRSLDPDAKIIGPSFSYYNNTRMSAFLTYCRDNDCLPDVICWHQWGAGGFVSALETYRSLELSLGIDPILVSINEYSSQQSDPYEGCPGYSVPFIAKFERHEVESACISWWHTAYPGRLGSLLTPSNEKGGGWYLYKWYGDMSGNMVSVTPPNDYSDGIDGFGCIDNDEYYASICIGGNNTGTVNVQVNNIPSTFGDAVNVTVEYVTWVDKDTPVSGTTTISTTEYSVSDNSITVPVSVTSILYAYRVYITPVEIVGPPTIKIISPDDNTGYQYPATIPVDVEVADADGTIAHIDFYDNDADTTFHEEWYAPYAFDWTEASAGLHVIKAIVYDDEGNSAEDSITVSVQGSYTGTAWAIPGTIEFEYYDLGGNGYAYYDDSDGSATGGDFRIDEDVDVEECSDTDGGYNIGYATAGEWLEYTVDVAYTGTYSLIIRAACNGDGRTISLTADGEDLAGDIAITNTGGWQVWTDITVDNIELQAGEHVIRLSIGTTDYVNLNKMTFTLESSNSIQLTAGWNLIGCPIEGSTEIASALSSIWEYVLTVKDADTFYLKTQDEFLNSLTTLKWGKGYLVKVSADCELDWIAR